MYQLKCRLALKQQLQEQPHEEVKMATELFKGCRFFVLKDQQADEGDLATLRMTNTSLLVGVCSLSRLETSRKGFNFKRTKQTEHSQVIQYEHRASWMLGPSLDANVLLSTCAAAY